MTRPLHIALIGALLLNTGASAAPKLTPELLESRNAASGYAGTLMFMVGLGARTCRDLLHRDDAYMNGIINDWLSRNDKYSRAGEQWMSFVLSTIANQQGLERATTTRDAMLATVKDNGTSGINALLGDTAEKKLASCSGYLDLVHAGKLDVAPSTKLYAELVELEQAVHGQK